ncbi:hypothetical protein BGZ54_007419 [Gamsiella multidivaricata]|nr:hypothetical protein BGZ54_007419 [Gamsiella multidivaricata]
MQSTLARHCFRCLALVRRTALSRPSHQRLLDYRPQTAATATFSSAHQQQIREAFLRAGPGRELGNGLRKGQRQDPPANASITSSSAVAVSQDARHPESEGLEPLSPSSDDNDALGLQTPPPVLQSDSLTKKKSSSSTPYREIVLLDTDFRERFIKGGGNGGQKINKTNSNVELKHYETGIVVQCQATRSLPQNRKLARKILIGRLDEYYNGDMSKRGQKAEKIRQRKMRMARKSAKKYHSTEAGTGSEELDLDDDDDNDVNDDGGDEDDERDKDEPEKEGGSRSRAKVETVPVPESTIRLTTLEEILASENKKPSRRKSARKE